MTSSTGKPLSGVNARRRRQAQKRLALLHAITGPATYEFWVRQPSASSTASFERLRAAMKDIASQCASPQGDGAGE